MDGCTNTNVKQESSKVSGQCGDMFSWVLVAKGNLLEAIVLKGQIGYPKNIGPRPSGFMS